MSVWREDPAAVRPMLASLDEPPVVARGMVYEPKYDGIRALVDIRPAQTKKDAPRVAIYSRNGNDKSAQFPGLVQALSKIAAKLPGPVLLDGEIVAVDEEATPLGFQHIQGRIHLTGTAEIASAEQQQPVALVLFDILRDDTDDLRGRPFAERRLRLQQRVTLTASMRRTIRLSEIAADDGRAMLSRAKTEGWEGLIAKDGQSLYQSGRRSPAWRKLKLLKQQEFVVGGWTEPRQTRSHFGALLLGYYDGAQLRWAGSVGTGFDQAELDRVSARLHALETRKSPFADSFKTAETAHWVTPDIVVEVRFTEWTSDSLLRHPVYLGMRTDKKARDVRREDAATPAKPVLPAPDMHRHNRRTPEPSQSPSLASPQRSKAQAAGAKTQASLIAELETLERSRRDGTLSLDDGAMLRVTNLAKLFWPRLGITKGELLRYYVEVAPLILPAVADRPLVMKRFPNGVDTHAFYQQRHPEAVPAGVRREELPASLDPMDANDGSRERLVGGSLTTLLYMTQLAAISQDPWFSRIDDPLHQDYTAIDLDPGDGVTFERVLDVARWVKDELDRLAIPAVPKTSGARGLHIYIPLPKRTTYETGQLLCQIVATIVSTKHPKVATIERMVKKRARGTVYVDYLQNILGKTLATAYSARASDYAGVSTPLKWSEVAKGVNPRDFTVRTALQRFREVGDLWAPLRTGKPVDLKRVLRK